VSQLEIQIKTDEKEEIVNKPKVLILLLVFSAIFAATLVPRAAAEEQPMITTERGPVLGIATDTLRMFLGIPYAAPPTGNLRWKPPEDHVHWFKPLEATRFGSHCPQVASVFGTASVTEDCLFLNVFTPNDETREGSSRRLPVMVWMHGGVFTVGESDDYIPTKLVQQGVIVVSINYRLGAL